MTTLDPLRAIGPGTTYDPPTVFAAIRKVLISSDRRRRKFGQGLYLDPNETRPIQAGISESMFSETDGCDGFPARRVAARFPLAKLPTLRHDQRAISRGSKQRAPTARVLTAAA